MASQNVLLIAADAILILHAVFTLYVVGGLLLIYVGYARRWRWVHYFWFRLTHLLAIGIVVVQALAGVLCPLTTLEMALRERAGEATYESSFIAHWVGRLIYYDLPQWVFALCYLLFGLLVAATWFIVPPRRPIR